MIMIRLSCFMLTVCFETISVASESFDMETGYIVEVEECDPFSEGSEIHFRQFDSDELQKDNVISADWGEASAEVAA